METIDIIELLKEHSREEVRQILVDAGLASDLLKAEFVIALSLGESKGDVIVIDPKDVNLRE